MVKERITIVLDKEIGNKLRTLQARKITTSHGNCSYSAIITLVLKEGLKHYSNSKK